jgi:hypothetical protein
LDLADYKINIYNVIGSKVDEIQGFNDYLKIDLSNYSNGIYVLEYISNIELFTTNTKFFVNK